MSSSSTSSSTNEKNGKEKNNTFQLNDILMKLNVNKINENNIKLKKSISQGFQGKIKVGIFKNLDVIIKLLPKENNIHILQEISNMVKYKNANIPKFLGVFQNEKYCGLVMEFIEGFNLSKIISLEKQGKITLSLMQKLNYLIQLSSVIDYLNSNNLIHRDLKTDNIMIDKLGQLKLIDFGISLQGKKIWINTDSPFFSLTPSYMAPEIVYQNEENNHITIKKTKEGKFAVVKNLKNEENINNKNDDDMNENWILITDKYDVWTFGIIMCQLFTRCKPWARNEQENLGEIEIQSRLVARLPYPINEFYPVNECNNYKDDFKNIIEMCLNFEPEERPSMRKVKEDLLKIYSKICNEKSIIEYYNQLRLNRIKNYEKNSKVLKISKSKKFCDEKIIFSKFRINRKKGYWYSTENIKENKNGKDDEIGDNNIKRNNSITLFKDKLLYNIMKENISLKQNIIIQKSIIQNDFNLKLNNIK
jgi:serine/threonine protein kinase